MKRTLSILVVILLASVMSAAPVMAQAPQPYPQMPGGQMPGGAGAPAEAKQIEGKIKTVNGGLVTLEDGTKLMIPASVLVSSKVERASLKEGATIKASFEQRAGQNIVTSIEVQ